MKRRGNPTKAELLAELARLREQAGALARRQEQTTLLLQAQQALAASLDLEQSLQAIVRHAAAIEAGAGALLLVLDPEQQQLRCRAATHLSPAEMAGIDLAFGQGLIGHVALTRQPLIVPNLQADPRLTYPELAAKYGFVSFLGLPVSFADRLLGVLAFGSLAPRTYTADDIAFLATFAHQAAIAIENARLYQAAQGELVERRKAEAALRESEQRYRALFESAGDAMFIHDLDGRILEVNQVACDRLGYQREELLGLSCAGIHAPEHAESVPARMREVSERGEAVFETVHLRRNGVKIPVEVGSRLIRYGGKWAALSIARDLTARREAEAALRASEERYRTLLANAPGIVCRCTAQPPHRTVFISGDVQGISGYPAAAFLEGGLDLISLVIAEDAPALQQTVAVAVASGRPFEVEFRIRHADGSIRWLHDRARPIYGEDRTVLWLEGLLLDVTAHKQAEQALAERTRQLHEVRGLSEEITRELDLTRLLELITRRAEGLLAAGAAMVYLWDESAQVLASAVRGGSRDWKDIVRFRLGEGVAGTVAARREGLIVNDYRTSPYVHPLFLERTSTTAVVAEPLLYRDRLVGVIAVDNEGTQRRFTEQDRATLALFAPPAAIAIENARLYAAAQQELLDRQRAEESLARERSLLRTLIDNIPDRIYIKDAEGRYLVDNAAHQHCLGAASLEAVVGKTLFDFFPPELADQHDADDRQVLATGQPLVNREELAPDHGTGPARHDLTTKVPLRDGEGRIAGVVSIARDITDYKRAEAALRESEERYRRIVETAHEGVWALDAEGVTTFVNRRMAEMLGYAPDEMLGRPLVAFMDEGDHPASRAAMERRSQGISEQFERRLRRKDGTELVTLVSATPIYDEEGRYRGSFGMLTDITVRKRAEQALTERTHELEAVRAVSEEITRELDLVRLLDLIHRRAAELVGAERGGILLWDEASQCLVARAWQGYGPWVAEIRFHPGQGVIGLVAERREGLLVNDYRNSPYAHPLVLERSDDTAVLCEPLLYRDRLLGSIVLSSAARGARFSGEHQRLLRLFAAQAAIAIENARLFAASEQAAREARTLYQVAHNLTTSLELPEVLQHISAQAVNLLGTHYAQVVLWDEETRALKFGAGHGPDADLCGKLDYQLGKGIAGTVAQTRRPLIVNDYQNFPNRFVELGDRVADIAVPLLYRDRLLGVLSTCAVQPGWVFTDHHLDLLTSFAAQAAIAIENARLFEELKQSYVRLQQAQDELLRTEKLRALGQMAAGIGHDLNNMLAAILGRVELLRLQTVDPVLRERLGTLETAAVDGAQIVRRLQSFARQQSTGPLIPCDLAALVQEAVEMTRPHWKDETERRGVRIEVRTDVAVLPPVLGQPTEIREALTNLILNAVDAMPDGGLLSLAGRAAPTGVTLTVKDTGVGMADEVRERIFEPFFTTKGVRGSGLGLSVVYGIMERHGGQIEVASTPGRGATFTLRFQVAPQDATAPEQRPPRHRHSRRILLVDDEAGVRRTIRDLLRSAGHPVIEADGGVAALALLRQTPVDLVLTDLGMPEVTGWDVARGVRSAAPHLPIVLLTGWGDQVVEPNHGPGLVDRILSKPIRFEDLLAVIAELTPEPPRNQQSDDLPGSGGG